MAMSKYASEEYKKAVAKRNAQIEEAIKLLQTAKNRLIDEDAAFDMWAAENFIQSARDYNVEAAEIRKAGTK